MRIKCDFEIVNMGDESIAVPVGSTAKEIQGVLKLNKEGEEILKLLCEGNNEEAIVELLAQKYENDRLSLSQYVSKVVHVLEEATILE